MKILWLNWKDIRHPQAGGAEVYTHQIAKRLVRKGHQVTLITSRFPQAKPEEEIDGIKIIRLGDLKTVYLHAYYYYNKYLKGQYDVVIEEINGNIAWLTPLYAKEPVITIRHQVEYTGPQNLYKSVLPYKLPPPIAMTLYLNEATYLKLYAKLKVPFITVSNSTKQDLIRAGIPPHLIHIVPNGLNHKPLEKVPQKDEEFTAVFLGRITPTKNPQHAIKAFLEYRKMTGKGKLIVIGQGELLSKLKRKYREPYIEFTGYVSEKEKREWLRRAYVLLAPSIREGWGQVVIEANAHGTPAIGYDVPGLRDSIRHMKTGMLVPYGDIKAMAKAMITLNERQELWRKMAENALQWARQFSWDKSVEKFEEIVSYIVLKSQPWLGSYNVTSLLKQLL